MVGAPGFEPGTSSPPDWHANQAAPRPVADSLARPRCHGRRLRHHVGGERRGRSPAPGLTEPGGEEERDLRAAAWFDEARADSTTFDDEERRDLLDAEPFENEDVVERNDGYLIVARHLD